MKPFNKFLTLSLIVVLVAAAATVDARRTRKLQPGAYISSAKIEILSGEEERIKTAMALLDSLFMHWGPHAEAYYWMSQIQVDLMNRRSDLEAKLPYAEKMVAYIDSLHMTCEDESIKESYRDDCDEYIQKTDSTRVLFWRQFYNAGVGQIAKVGELMTSIENETDSSALEYYKTSLAAQLDSCKDNMALAVTIDSTDPRTYIGLASAYEKTGDFATSREWLLKALDKSEDRSEVLIQIAYNYIQSNEYCEAIPYFEEYIEIITADDEVMSNPDNIPSVVGTMYNLTICYNNCQHYDKAYELGQRILTYDPENAEVLQAAGRYHNQMARQANDSANVYKESDAEKYEYWSEQKKMRFDSARVFLKKAFELHPDNKGIADEYGVTSAILGNLQEAAVAFSRITEIDPDDARNWTSLGDCYLSLHEFEKAAEAYEKVIELQPENSAVMETLRDVYKQLGENAKAAELDKKLAG